MLLKKWLENQVAGEGIDSLAVRMRKRRMEEFENFFIAEFKGEIERNRAIQILDLGGTDRYWNTVNFKYRDKCVITLLNLEKTNFSEDIANRDMYCVVEGDATDLSQYSDKSFDLCFSNSVIEHVGNIYKQQAMADEMKRVGRHIYLQTPNYWFPFEPHYRLPLVHWLPLCFGAWCGYKWNMGYFKGVKSMEKAIEVK